MTRIGINPARGKTTSRRPARVSVAMVTYLPSLNGYFENRMDVLKLTIASLKAHTSLPVDFCIFDNGSCKEAVDYLVSLREMGQADYLLLSERNIGKIDALQILFNAAPGEIIAYNDDDIFFYPGWLKTSLEVLESFPMVGTVSGTPVRNAAQHANHSLLRFVEQNDLKVSVRRERAIKDEWERDWALSTGRDPEKHREETRELLDTVFSIQTPAGKEVLTIAGANHFQFVAPKEVIIKALPNRWTGLLMGSMIELDEAVDRLGYLRLSTAQRYTRHIGNRISDELHDEAESFGLRGINQKTSGTRRHAAGKKHWLLKVPGGRRGIQALYCKLFDILYNRE